MRWSARWSNPWTCPPDSLVNFARLNHILIPARHEDRERLRGSRLGKLIRPVGKVYEALSVEGRALVLLTLFIGVASVEVGTTRIYVLWSVLVGLVLASLAMRLAFRSDGLTLEVRAPSRVAAGESVRFELLLHNAGERPLHTLRIHGPFLPWDGAWESSMPARGLLEPDRTVRLSARARFVHRGSHHIEPFRVGALVPFGLALGPSVWSTGTKFLVIPRIANVTRLELPRGQRFQPGGVAQASRLGEALEIVGVRPYRPGDSVRDLHAKTWARTGQPHVREYNQEYFTRIGVVLDNDRTAASEEALEAAVSLAAGVVSRLSRGEVLVDLLVVGDELHQLTLGRSLGTLDQALDLLANTEPGAKLEPEQLLARLEPHAGRLSAVVLVALAGDAPRAQLIAGIERLGVACVPLRIDDDSPRLPFTKRHEQEQLPLPGEQLVRVSDVDSGRELML